MSNMTKIIGAVALGLGVAVAIPVLGHGYGGGMHGPYGDDDWGPGRHMGMHNGQMHDGQMHYGGNFEQRLSGLKESLELTDEQQPAWDQYEQAVKTMTEGHPRWGKAPRDAESRFDRMEQHFTQMKAVFESRKALYETLTDEQKETVDKYTPGPFGHHYGYNSRGYNG